MLDNLGTSGEILTVEENVKNSVVDKLLSQSQENSTYYTLLVVSTLIIGSGILLSNSFIIIGGIVMAPVLNPILVIALSIAVGELTPIKNVAFLLLKSFVLVLIAAVLLSVVFSPAQNLELFENTMRTAILYFIVAVSSGVGATFGLVRREISRILPGTAIAVSLIPPLVLMGIWIGAYNVELVRYYIMVFLFNVCGVIVGSIIVFSLLKFYKNEAEVAKKGKEIELKKETEKLNKKEDKIV